jgi:hypothetical protein
MNGKNKNTVRGHKQAVPSFEMKRRNIINQTTIIKPSMDISGTISVRKPNGSFCSWW